MSLRILDRLTLVGIACGIALMLQPVWHGGFRLGFFVTIGFTIGQIVTSHLLPGSPSKDESS